MADGMDQLAWVLYDTWARVAVHQDGGAAWEALPEQVRKGWRAVAERAERALVGQYDNPGPMVRLAMPDPADDMYVRPIAATNSGLWAMTQYIDELGEENYTVSHTGTGWGLVKGVTRGAARHVLEALDAMGNLPEFLCDTAEEAEEAYQRNPRLLAALVQLAYVAEHWEQVGQDPDA